MNKRLIMNKQKRANVCIIVSIAKNRNTKITIRASRKSQHTD